MRILPVLDVMRNQVVRGVGGRRAEYRPIVSRLTSSVEPAEIALAIRESFGVNELYFADLDALAGAPPAWTLYERLHQLGFRLWVDAGVRDLTDAQRLGDANVWRIILGLETIAGPATLEAGCRLLGADRVIFSLDLRGGQPLGDREAWMTDDPLRVAKRAMSCGVHQLLVLDLAHVGTGTGTGTEALCSRLSKTHPYLKIAAGGGIRDVAAIQRLGEYGVTTVLLASALHDGRLSREALAGL